MAYYNGKKVLFSSKVIVVEPDLIIEASCTYTEGVITDITFETTFEEIISAINKGKKVLLELKNTEGKSVYIPLTSIDETTIVFTMLISEETILTIKYSSDGSVSLTTTNKIDNFGSCKKTSADYPTVGAVGDYVKSVMPTITLDDYLKNPSTLIHETGKEFYTEPKASVSNPFYCSAGDNIKATLSNYKGNFAVFVTYDKNDNIVTFIGSNNDEGFRTLIEINHTFTSDERYFRIGGVTDQKDNYSLTYTSADNKWQNYDTDFAEQSKKTDNVERQVFSLYGADYELGYLRTAGSFVALASYRTTKPIFVKAGTVIKYRLKHGSSAPIIALYEDIAATQLVVVTVKTDEETEVEQPCVVMGSTEVAEGEYKVPKDGYIRFVYIPSYTDGYVRFTDTIPDNVKQYVDDSIKTYSDENTGSDNTELYVDSKIERLGFSLYGADYEQGFINAYGVFKANSIYRATNPIFVKAGTTLKYNLQHGTAAPIIAFYENSNTSKDSYNAEKSVIGIAGVTEGIYTAPSDGYVRFVELVSHTDGYVWFEDAIFDYVDNGIRQCIDSNALKMNILCLGDSILGNDGQIVEYVAEFTGANVINGAFGGTSVSPRASTTDKYYPLDGENLITALTTPDFESQNEVKSKHTATVQSRIEMLETLDMSSIDLIILGWGTNDYTQGKTIEDISQSLSLCIDMLQTKYPAIRILVLTNTWRFWSIDDEAGNKVYKDSDSMIYNVSTGKEIAEGIEETCKNKRISVLNSYQNMPVSLANAPTYFDSVATATGDDDSQSGVEIPIGSGKYYSGVHFNKTGNEMYAHIIAGKIRSMY